MPPSPAPSTRDRIVRTAHDLFYTDGFHAVGLDRILESVGVTKTTFYNHFESKDDLVLEALKMHDRWWRNEFMELLRKHGGDTPRGQLLAVFDALDEIFADAGYNGCIFINVGVEFPLPHDPAHEAAAEHKGKMVSIIRELAGYAGAEDPGAFAEELSMVMEGAYVRRQLVNDGRTAEIGRRLVAMLVERRLGGS